MAREFDHTRLTPSQVSEGLDRLGVEPREFARLTGASPESVKQWLMPSTHPRHVDPPYWVTGMLALALRPGGLEALWDLADVYLIKGERHEPATD